MQTTGQQSFNNVTSIELVTPLSKRRVIERLSSSINNAERLRAAIAYWSISPDDVNKLLVSRLSHDGFLCVDIHLPTDIDILCKMKQAGANLYIHLRHPNPQPADLKTHVPDHLLHPKILLFDLPGEKAELWVGSHNWTVRALSGLNIEASIVLVLSRDDALYRTTEQFLDEIRTLCKPFDLSSRSYYKWLQGQATEQSVWVIELQGALAANLSGERVTVFETSEEQYRDLRNVDRDIIVSALDQRSGEKHLYEGAIVDTGRLPSPGLTFEKQIHALHRGQGRPNVVGPSVPPTSVLEVACGRATVQVETLLPVASRLYELPPAEKWQITTDDPFERRVASEDRKLFSRPDRPLVSRPVSKAVYEGWGEERAEEAMPMGQHELVRRMVLRKQE